MKALKTLIIAWKQLILMITMITRPAICCKRKEWLIIVNLHYQLKDNREKKKIMNPNWDLSSKLFDYH